MKIYLRKLATGALVPDDEQAIEALKKIKVGTVVSAEVKQPRNYPFHKKYMLLLTLGFSSWMPQIAEYKGLPAQKNFDRFRKDVAIACGFYTLTVNLKGEVRAEADSISFGKMNAEDFESLYQKTITLFIHHYQILIGYKDAAEVDAVIMEMLEFAR